MTALGRPREFDRDDALRDAMLVFWRKGFLATSMTDLCEAMGIRSPSLYAAFGSKENLYAEAVQHYVAQIRPLVWDRLEDGPTARAGIEKMLLTAADVLPGDARLPPGCMVTLAATTEQVPGTVAETARQARQDGLALVRGRLERAVVARELPPATDVDLLSRFYLGVFQGMAIQARDGASSAQLASLASMAMAAWPAVAIRKSRGGAPSR